MTEPEGDALLELRELTMRFGGVVAISQLDLIVRQGEIFGLIGPNGAGKTTVFNVVTGVYQPTQGQVLLRGEVIQNKRPHLVTKLGVARTFQNIRLFHNMTALENVMVGADARHRGSVPSALVRSSACKVRCSEEARVSARHTVCVTWIASVLW